MGTADGSGCYIDGDHAQLRHYDPETGDDHLVYFIDPGEPLDELVKAAEEHVCFKDRR